MLLTGNKTGLARYLAECSILPYELPAIANKAKGGLVVCGDAACIWADLEAFGCRCDEGRGTVAKSGFEFLVINKLGETFPGTITHWYSNAAHMLPIWRSARRQEYDKEFGVIEHTHSCQAGALWRWPWGGHGTSGLGGVLTGVAMGYSPVVLCGLPLDDGPHNGEPPWRRTKFASSEAADGDPHWRMARTAFKGTVFSMSGNTKQWFGPPHD